MDRQEDNATLIQRISDAPKPVVLLSGPAGSGKTTASLDIYRSHIGPDGQSKCMLLAPNAKAAAFWQRKLLDQSPAGLLISPQVTTFASLGGRILTAAGDTGKMLGDFQRRFLIRQIIDELNSSGKLTALSAVADTPGLPSAMDRSIAELKRAAIEPEALAATVGPHKGKSQDLLSVYRRYQQALHESGSYDLEGRMWQARNVIANSPAGAAAPGLDGIDCVVLDGFTDFTPTQLEIVRLISQRLRRVVITLPFARDGRQRLWQWTSRTLERMRRVLGDDLCEIDLPAIETPLLAAQDSVFDMDAAKRPAPEGISIIAAAGIEAEVSTVARRIKQLLASGDSPGSIAVLARSLDSYRNLIARVFGEFDIPTPPPAIALTEAGAVRFLLDVASLSPEFDYRCVLRVISSSYFRPQALGQFAASDIAAAEMIIRRGNVLKDRITYAWACERLAATRQVDDDNDQAAATPRSASPDQLRSAATMLSALFDLAESASTATGLLSMIDSLQLHQAAVGCGDAELIARDLRALGELTSTLETVDPGTPARAITDALGAITASPERGESLVDVLDVIEARPMRYDHVFLLGLSEGDFPRKFTESSLIRESDRAAWQPRGLELDLRGDLTAREMLLFYMAISRADKTLTLSYLESDSSGRYSAAGAFLEAMLDPLDGLDLAGPCDAVERIVPGSFLPANGKAASPDEALSVAIFGLFAPTGAGIGDAIGWANTHQPDRIARAAMGLLARYRRYLPGACDRFDGRITNDSLVKELALRFPGRTIFSANRLDTFGQCPWQFFGRYILHLEPPDEPQRRLDPLQRGTFAHNVLFEVMTNLRDETDGRFSLATVEAKRLIEVLDSAVAKESARMVRVSAYPELLSIQLAQVHRQLRSYLISQQPQCANVEHLSFELGFGMEADPDNPQDAASDEHTVSLETPAGPVQVRGRVDRVDRLHTDDGEGLFVIDYKTGQLPTHKDIDAGRNLQLPIYTEVVERMGHQQCLGGAFHKITGDKVQHFSSIKPPARDPRTFDERRSDAMETIGEFVQQMAAGAFDCLPSHNCPTWCPLRQICHYSPARAEFKNREGPS